MHPLNTKSLAGKIRYVRETYLAQDPDPGRSRDAHFMAVAVAHTFYPHLCKMIDGNNTGVYDTHNAVLLFSVREVAAALKRMDAPKKSRQENPATETVPWHAGRD